MKKKILTLALVLSLLVALVIPASVALAQTTDVGGNVVAGHTFTAPTGITLGDMAPGSVYADNTAGSLDGNNAAGYTVTGIDVGTNPGYMDVGANVLASMLLVGPAASPTDTADAVVTFLDENAAGSYAVPFYVSQAVTYSDPVAVGYSITITFTVTPK